MAGVLVYIPNGKSQDPRAELVRVGLSPLLDRSVDPLPTEIQAGPDGGPGLLVTFDAIGLAATPREINQDTQEWLAAPPDGELPKDRYWLGYVKDQKPSAGELQRAELFDGEPVTLRDGNGWVIPISTFLPKRLTRDRTTGKELRVVAAEHREFDEWSSRIFEQVMASGFEVLTADKPTIHVSDGMRYVAAALAKNYRVTYDLVDLLDLVGDYEAAQAALVACSFTLFRRVLAQKKSTEQQCQLAGAN